MSKKFDKKAILELAKERECENDALFLTTLDNLEVLELAIGKIREIIESDELLIEKTYVKGRENICLHPAIKELSKLTDSANKTLSQLYTSIEKASGREYTSIDDPLLKYFD